MLMNWFHLMDIMIIDYGQFYSRDGIIFALYLVTCFILSNYVPATLVYTVIGAKPNIKQPEVESTGIRKTKKSFSFL